MATNLHDKEVSERLRDWIKENYTQRGKFTLLQKESGLPAQRWKDLYYGRQYASAEMLSFVESVSVSDAGWIRTGIRPVKKEGYPFLTYPPAGHETQTLAGRLVWVIKEWTSPKGAELFSYLADRYEGIIGADEWAAVILKGMEPSLSMVRVVCEMRPHFTEWVITGGANSNTIQVDPTSHDSIQRWKEKQITLFGDMDAVLSANLKRGNK